jgi:hypothetical protein
MILGIDPGLDGAIAVLTEAGELIAVQDMPTLLDGAKGRRAVNPALFASIVYSTHASRAYCELIGPRPTDGTTSAFGFGRSRGIIEGVLAAAGVPLEMIAPPVWKRAAFIKARPGEQGQRPQRRDQPMAVAGGALRAQMRLRPRRGGVDRARGLTPGCEGRRMIRSAENPKKREAIAKLRKGKITIEQAAKLTGAPISGVVGWMKLAGLEIPDEYRKPRRAHSGAR